VRRFSYDLPLHGGKAPRWLFARMVKLAREITVCLVEEFGPAELLRRISDPLWFQALGCVLGFDWHSSGVTTTVCGALKEALRDTGGELGVFAAGGKGARSRRTPAEIEETGMRHGIDADPLVYASRMSAKVDSAALQDGFQVYQHTFFFTTEGKWAVVQQGMNEDTRTARRYHWLCEGGIDFVCEPHAAVCSDVTVTPLNLVARESGAARESIAALSGEPPEAVLREVRLIHAGGLPARHRVSMGDIDPRKLHTVLLRTYERAPRTFEEVLGIRGVGPKAVRALALVGELIYGTPASVRDPVRFSFAHGGKDGTPYPVDRETYDRTIETLHALVNRSRVGYTEKKHALRRLHAAFGAGGKREEGG